MQVIKFGCSLAQKWLLTKVWRKNRQLQGGRGRQDGYSKYFLCVWGLVMNQIALFEFEKPEVYRRPEPVFDPCCPVIRQKLADILRTGEPDEWFVICPQDIIGNKGAFHRSHGVFGKWSAYFGGILHFALEDGLIECRVLHDGSAPEFGGQSSSKYRPLEVIWTGKCDPKIYRGYGYEYRLCKGFSHD